MCIRLWNLHNNLSINYSIHPQALKYMNSHTHTLTQWPQVGEKTRMKSYCWEVEFSAGREQGHNHVCTNSIIILPQHLAKTIICRTEWNKHIALFQAFRLHSEMDFLLHYAHVSMTPSAQKEAIKQTEINGDTVKNTLAWAPKVNWLHMLHIKGYIMMQ